MSKWLRNSDYRIQRIYENMEAWAKDEIAHLCREWRPHKIVYFKVEPYCFTLTACCWHQTCQDNAQYYNYATHSKRLVIRPRRLRIAESGWGDRVTSE